MWSDRVPQEKGVIRQSTTAGGRGQAEHTAEGHGRAELHGGEEWSNRATDLIPTRKQNGVTERDKGQDISFKALLVIFFLGFL